MWGFSTDQVSKVQGRIQEVAHRGAQRVIRRHHPRQFGVPEDFFPETPACAWMAEKGPRI